jgi:nitrite reductase (NO-forming)
MTRVTAAVLFAFAFCASASGFAEHHGHSTAEERGQVAENGAQAAKPVRAEGAAPAMHAQAVFTLRTGVAEGRLVFLGAAGGINGQINPILMVHQRETVQINLVNGEGAQHDTVIDQFGARSDMVVGKGASSIR